MGQQTAGNAAEVVLRVENLVKHFPVKSGKLLRAEREYVHAVENVSLEVRRGKTLGLVGETGCGKSTLARCAARLYPVTSGKIFFDGQDITDLSSRRMRPLRREIQMIFQDPYGSLNPRRRVGSIIGDPFSIHRTARGEDRKRKVQHLMEMVGLNPEHYNRFPAEFSGGQRQRIGVARALAFQPKLIICDEPVSALDVSIQAQILNLLSDLQRDLGLTYIFIAHDLSVVRHVSDRVAVMYLGKIVEQSPADDDVGAAQASLHRRTAVGCAVARPGARTAARADHPRRRRSVADPPARWLPVPPALPEGEADLRQHRARTHRQARRRRGAPSRVSFPSRRRRGHLAVPAFYRRGPARDRVRAHRRRRSLSQESGAGA